MKNPLKPCSVQLGKPVSRKPLLSVSLLALSVAFSCSAQAQDTSSSASGKLSDWLLAHPAADNEYLLGLSWRVPSEVPTQQALRAGLLRDLDALEDGEQDAQPLRQYLRRWLAQLPVTGRVPVAASDLRWLQANPARDPVLQSGHNVVLPQRPTTVTVLGVGVQPCQVAHEALRPLMDYVNACASDHLSQADWVWVVQPDGRVQRFGVAFWNLTPQGEPAPGAWIWAPSRKEAWPEAFSDRLAEFLATQSPAPDVSSAKPVEPVASSHSIFAAGTPRGLALTSSDWGGVGVMQTPSARMREAGDMTVNLTRDYPYTQMNVSLQPFDWMEAGFRYSTISNRLYGPAIAGGQSYKDKSIDVKLRLLEESAYLPQLAVGWRDLVGTGLFSGEYLVASKRTGDFDWSLGLGWGYVGNRGDLKNPLGYLSQGMNTRPKVVIGQGGNFSLKSYFRGASALFGGVQYQTPWEPLVLKLEYDGNNYQREPLGNVLKQSSPFNFGAVYKATEGVDISFGVERGNTAMLGLTLRAPLAKIYQNKVDDPPRVPVLAVRPQQPPNWAATSEDISKQTDWQVKRIEQTGRDLRVTLDDAEAGYWRQRLERGLAVLHRDAPANVDSFTVVYRDHGVEMAEHQVERDAWVDQQTQNLPPSEQQNPLMTRAPTEAGNSHSLYEKDRPVLENTMGGGMDYSMGGPDSFLLYQLYVDDEAKLNLGESTWLQGRARLGVIDNYNKFKYTAPSGLPRVRTFVREFVTSSDLTLPNLQLTHTGKVGENNFYSIYAGYLEEMYAGVGGEWLYRPFESAVALGVDVNAVKMRGFKQDFSLQKYQTTTGHASLYWDTGWNNLQAKVSVGRYLAKDIGMSLQLTRHFDNGVTMGGGLTKTNVPVISFGEGSFDKWVQITIPFDALLTRSTSSDAHLTWQPLLRDGGAKLNRQVELYELTKTRDPRTLQITPAPLPNAYLIPEDQHEAWEPQPKGIEPYTRVASAVPAKQWVAEDQSYQWRLEEALYRQQFRHIKIDVDADARLSIRVSNEYMHPASLAVGRAVRTALLNAPQETRSIRITLLDRPSLLQAEVEPVVEYDFTDLKRLKYYLEGRLTESGFASSVKVNYLVPSASQDNPLYLLADTTPIQGKPSSLVEAAAPALKPVARVRDDLVKGFYHAEDVDWLRAVTIGGGIVLASSLLDKPADRFVLRNAQSGVLKNVNSVGNTLVPLLTAAGAAMAALSSDDPLLSQTGYTSIEAGGTALALGLGTKFAVGRARPFTGQGNASFHPFAASAKAGTDGFPSGHTVIVWAMLTPFAEAYEKPWLYGVAGLTNLARVGSRNHWVSDTVAGSVLGYAIGKILWESSHNPSSNYPRLGVNGRDLTLTWTTP